jgi:hypothetical protein
MNLLQKHVETIEAAASGEFGGCDRCHGLLTTVGNTTTGGAGPYRGKMHGVGNQSRENQW